MPRKVSLVLEYDGAAYNRVLSKRELLLADEQLLLANNPANAEFETRVKRAQDSLDEEQNSNIRLFAIDAGLDKTAPQNKYPDPTHYIIMQALIKPLRVKTDQQDELTGWITGMMNTDVGIPLEPRRVFETLEVLPLLDLNRRPPRYKLKVAFGKRGEPWVISAEKL